jgi:hypothetical protein
MSPFLPVIRLIVCLFVTLTPMLVLTADGISLSGEPDLDGATLQGALDEARRVPKSEVDERESAIRNVLAIANAFLKTHGQRTDALLIKVVAAIELDLPDEVGLTGEVLLEKKKTATAQELEKLNAVLTEMNSRGWLSPDFIARQERRLAAVEAASRSFKAGEIETAKKSMDEAWSLSTQPDSSLKSLKSDIDFAYKQWEEKKQRMELFLGVWTYRESFQPEAGGRSWITLVLTVTNISPVGCSLLITGGNSFSDRDLKAQRRIEINCPGQARVTGKKTRLRGPPNRVPDYDISNKSVTRLEFSKVEFDHHGIYLFTTISFADGSNQKVTWFMNPSSGEMKSVEGLWAVFDMLGRIARRGVDSDTAESEIISRCTDSESGFSQIKFQ